MFEEDIFEQLPFALKCIAMGMIADGILPKPRYWYVEYIEGMNNG